MTAAETHSPNEFSFGSFRLLRDQRLLLKGEKPVRLGGRAHEILAALLGRPGRGGKSPIPRRRPSQGAWRWSRRQPIHRQYSRPGILLRGPSSVFRTESFFGGNKRSNPQQRTHGCAQ